MKQVVNLVTSRNSFMNIFSNWQNLREVNCVGK